MGDYPKTLNAAGIPYTVMLRGGAELSQDEVAKVAELIHAGGAVKGSIEQIEGRVTDAHLFALALWSVDIVGVAALKAPQQQYRDYIKQKTGIDLLADEYPAELDYVAISNECRGRSLSSLLMAELMSRPAGSDGVFATTKREAFCRVVLPDLGFKHRRSYRNDKGETVHLLTKPAA